MYVKIIPLKDFQNLVLFLHYNVDKYTIVCYTLFIKNRGCEYYDKRKWGFSLRGKGILAENMLFPKEAYLGIARIS